MGRILFFESQEFRRQMIFKKILDLMGDPKHLFGEAFRLREETEFREMEEDVARQLLFGEMTAHDPRHGLCLVE